MKENFYCEDISKDVILSILYKNHISILLVHSDENENNRFVPTKNII